MILHFQLDLDEMSVENALSKSYHKIIKFQLEPVWHQVKFQEIIIILLIGY